MADNDFITRAEYEARQAELRTEIIRQTTDSNAQFKYIVEEFKRLTSTNEQTRLDMRTELDKVSEKIDKASLSTYRYVATSVINFILGGGIIGLLSYLHLIGH